MRESTNLNGLRIGFIIGHTKLKPGAKGFQLLPENHFHRKIVEKYLSNYDVFYHDSYNFGYTSMCKRTAKRINAKEKYDVIFALHFNASEDSSATGSEFLYYFKNGKAKKIGNIYLSKLTKKFGTRNRGARSMYNKKQRGFSEIYYPRDSVVLLEPYFCSNLDETKKFTVDSYGEFLKNFADNLYL